MVVVTLGERGCLVRRGNEQVHCPGVSADLVDTTGAGDLFTAGFLHQWLQKMSLSECGAFANRVASRCVEQMGPTLTNDQWEALLLGGEVELRKCS